MNYKILIPPNRGDTYRVRIDTENIMVSHLKKCDEVQIVFPIYCDRKFHGIPEIEPQPDCCIMDENGNILLTAESVHKNPFWITRSAECHVKISDFRKRLKEVGYDVRLDAILERFLYFRLHMDYEETDYYLELMRKEDSELAKHNAIMDYINGRASWVPGSYPQVSGGYPQVSGGYPQVSGGYPQVSGGYPQVSGGYPQVSGSYPQVSGGYPQVSGSYPQIFDGYPQTFGGNPRAFGGYPQTSAGKTRSFGGKPQTSDGKPQPSDGKPQPFGGNPEMTAYRKNSRNDRSHKQVRKEYERCSLHRICDYVDDCYNIDDCTMK